MNREQVADLIQDITVWKRSDKRAPHKPLLLLLALGRVRRGEPRLVAFEEIEDGFGQLLEDFGPPRRVHHPEYPFWRLENDGLWRLEGPKREEIVEMEADPSAGYLRRHRMEGGFPEEIQELLEEEPALIAQLAEKVLEAHFPRTLHDDIISAVGLDLEVSTTTRRPRDPAFREVVLRAYEFRCAICGFDVRLRNQLVGVEAAHIKWHQAQGPDSVNNGLALCALHHKLFDRGAFTVSTERSVRVSQEVNGSDGFRTWLLDFHDREIRGPQADEYDPGADYLSWHHSEVFRSPARPTTGR